VPSGATSVTFTVTTRRPSSSSVTVTITASNQGITKTATVVVRRF
jgi:hypothetical protein